MYVIGTAGHVDHGKSVLVHALTGIDPDRLREEKERGMTIDLGFAWLTLPGGQEVSIVDVPGHERFVRNMLAGAGGIDLALLVVAADEGVMPQTREHLAILDFLQIRSGVVAITKKDLAEQDWVDLVAADIAELLKGTALNGSPIVACSAVTGEGLDELVSTLERRLIETAPKRDIGRPRLPIDRAFTIAGFGTVVTGTLIDGSFEVGQEVEVVPGGLRSRIRGLQTHRHKVQAAHPGTRTAINLAGLATDDLARGQVVALPGALTPSIAVDVRLRACAADRRAPRSLRRTIRHNVTVSFHTGSSEVSGRVRLLDSDELRPGQQGWAQVRLAQPMALVKGDFFVVRSGGDTIGGGEIVDARPRRHRRFHAPTIEALSLAERGAPEDTLLSLLARMEPCELATLVKRSELAAPEAQAAAEGLVQAGRAVALGAEPPRQSSLLFTAEGFSALKQRAADAIAAYHRQHPLRAGMPREELKSRLGLSSRPFGLALERWIESGELEEKAGAVALPGRRAELTSAQESAARAFVESLKANPYAPPTEHPPDEELIAYLEQEGEVVSVGDGVVFASDAYQEMVERIVAHLRAEGTLTLAQMRDMFGTSRKYAQALLEHLDERRVTRRVGGERMLRKK
jgi:selenocysteine-specific elongation factor